MKGRIYIGEEGISATLTGNDGQIRAYKLYLQQSKYFQNIPDIDIKATRVDEYYFDRMIVKYRKEIVALGTPVTQAEIEQYHQKMSADDFKKLIDSGDLHDRVIIDMRNDYEYKLGHFKNAIPAGTINFREVPELLAKYKELFGEKKIVRYCTGGIRCEKLSAIVHKAGLNNVYALDGGVVGYVNQHNDGNRLGNLYTFDGRVSARVGDDTTHVAIGECIYTGLKTDNCENCRYSPCNARIICRRNQYKRFMGFCSQECYENAKRDMLIKDADRDSFDYQAVRDALKDNTPEADALRQAAQEHLAQKLGNTTFPHKVSQKETVIFQE